MKTKTIPKIITLEDTTQSKTIEYVLAKDKDREAIYTNYDHAIAYEKEMLKFVELTFIGCFEEDGVDLYAVYTLEEK